MELKKLTLKNFRTHRKLEIDFKSGITGIVGNNGTGKSSIVEAIIFLFTGEGYGFKGDMLSVGEESGYVMGNIMIDGKEAVLERHLDTSKVNFKYDGITYKKSGEVAEIWDKLFQIDKNIFKNIVVARQGDIALLFSGDNSVKEKIFQKIFLVPNTTKVRDTIWNKYIKTAPPEYPLLDEPAILQEIKDISESSADIKKTLDTLDPDLSGTHADLISRLKYLDSCNQAEAERNVISEKIAELENNKLDICEEINKIDTKLNSVDISDITEKLQELKASRPLYENKKQLTDSLVASNNKKPEEVPQEEIARLATLRENLNKLKTEYDVLAKDYNDAIQTVDNYKSKGLLDVDNCPHCGSELKDIGVYIAHMAEKAEEIHSKIQVIQKEYNDISVTIKDIEYNKNLFDSWKADNDKILAGLAPLEGISFDQNDYEIYSAVVSQYNSMSLEKQKLSQSLPSIESGISSLNIKKATLPAYDQVKISIEVEQDDIQQKINNIVGALETSKDLQIKLANNENMISLKRGELERNENTKKHNSARNKYVGILNDLYEMLATSQFPRKLIQTYSSNVSEYLSENLRNFNFPYRAEVNDNFGIDVFDDQGRKLPSVSGGQEIMIGVALRLALHSMFGEAFPMMIFDEGSVHLSQESKKNYFEVIKNMNEMSKLKQIIIIDHDEDLIDVVDNTVKL